MNWYIKVLKNYAVFSGRATRKEYWMFVLFNFIFGLVAYLIDLGIGLLTFAVFGFFGFGLLYFLYTLAVLVPSLAVSVRRLHDVGKSGWYLLINLIPIVGPIWFLVLLCIDSQPGDNIHGPNPKGEEESGRAIGDYNKVIGLNANDSLACYDRGVAAVKRGEVSKAVSDLERCIELSTDPKLIRDAKQVLFEMGYSSRKG